MSSVADVYRKRLAYPEDADKSLSEIRQERLDNALQIQQDANEEAARQAKEREDKLKKMGYGEMPAKGPSATATATAPATQGTAPATQADLDAEMDDEADVPLGGQNLDRLLFPGVAESLTPGRITAIKAGVPQEPLVFGLDEVDSAREAAGVAYDAWRSVVDVLDGDVEKAKVAVLARNAPVAGELERTNPKAFKYLTELADREHEPYSFFFRNTGYTFAAPTTQEGDAPTFLEGDAGKEANARDQREEYVSSQAVRSLRLGPEQTPIKELYSVFMPRNIAEVDITGTQNDLYWKYYEKLLGDAELDGKEVTDEDKSAIQVEAAQRAKRDIEKAMSVVGSPVIYSMVPDKTPQQMAAESRDSLFGGAGMSLNEARFAPRYMQIPEAAGTFDKGLIGGINTVGYLGQLISVIDPTEVAGVAADVAASEYKRSIERETDEDGEVDAGDVITSLGRAYAAGGLSSLMQTNPLGFVGLDVGSLVVGGTLDAALGDDFHKRVVENTIIATADAEDFFDATTEALPTLVAAAGRVATGVDNEEVIRRMAIENQFEAKSLAFLAAVVTPGPAISDMFGGVSKMRAASKTKKTADGVAEIIERGITDDGVADVDGVIRDIGNAHGIGVQRLAMAAATSAAANAAEKDADILSRNVGGILRATKEASAELLQDAEAQAAAARQAARAQAEGMESVAGITEKAANDVVARLAARKTSPDDVLDEPLSALEEWKIAMQGQADSGNLIDVTARMDRVFEATDKVRGKIVDAIDDAEAQVRAIESQALRPEDVQEALKYHRAEVAAKRAIKRIEELATTSPKAAAMMDDARALAKALQNMEAIRKRVAKYTESLGASPGSIKKPRADVEADLAAVTKKIADERAAGNTASRDDITKMVVLRERLAATPKDATDVSLVDPDLLVAQRMLKDQYETVKRARARMTARQSEDPALYKRFSQMIEDAHEAGKVIGDVDNHRKLIALRKHEASIQSLRLTQKRLQGRLEDIAKVDAYVALKTQQKYSKKGVLTSMPEGSVIDDVIQRRKVAFVSARRLLAKNLGDPKAAFEALRKASSKARVAAREAAKQRIAAAQRKALRDFAASLRRGADEVKRRGAKMSSVTSRTGRLAEDNQLLDRARTSLQIRLGKDDVFGSEISKAQFIDNVVESVSTIADDVVKYMDDPEDIIRVIQRFAPGVDTDDIAARLANKEARQVFDEVLREYADIQWKTFSAMDTRKVVVENVHQAVTEAANVTMGMRRAERDLNLALSAVQTKWAQNGMRYAIYKLLSPRASFIGEGSDHAWRTFQHADQLSAAMQSWLVVHSTEAIDRIMKKSGAQYTRQQLAKELIDAVSSAFDTNADRARIGLPADSRSMFVVFKEFILQRRPTANEQALTQGGEILRESMETAKKISNELSELSADNNKITRAEWMARQELEARQMRLAKAQANLDNALNALRGAKTEVDGNAASLSDARVRLAELEAELATAKSGVRFSNEAWDDAVEVADDAFGRASQDLADAKARKAQLEQELAAAENAVAPTLSPAERSKRMAAIQAKREALTIHNMRLDDLRIKWMEAQDAEAAKAKVLGGDDGSDKTVLPANLKSLINQAMSSLKPGDSKSEAVARAVDAFLKGGGRWSQMTDAAMRLNERHTGTLGGIANQLDLDVSGFEQIIARLSGLAKTRGPDELLSRVTEPGYGRILRAIDEMQAAEPNNKKIATIREKARAATTVKEAGDVVAGLIKQGKIRQKEVVDYAARLIDKAQGTPAAKSPLLTNFEDTPAYKAHQAEAARMKAEIDAESALLDVRRRDKDQTVQAKKSELNTLTNELRVLQGKAQAAKVALDNVKARKATPKGSVQRMSVEIAQNKQKQDALQDDIRRLKDRIDQFARYSSRDLSSLQKVADDAKTAFDGVEGTVKAAQKNHDAARVRLADHMKKQKALAAEIEDIRARARAQTPSEVKEAIQEGALDEKTMSLFDKMILNMGRSVFRGVQATDIDEKTANKYLYSIALDAIKKSDNFADLHANITKGILGRFIGSRIIDERAPRTVNALAAAIMQGVVADYTTQYALREGLAVVEKRSAMAYNALMSQPIGGAISNPLTVIRDVYDAADEVLRVGARVARSKEGVGRDAILDRHGEVGMHLVEAARLPGFAEGVWIPENVLATSLKDLEGYSRQMDVLVATAPSEVGAYLADKAKKVFSIWRTKTLVGYGVNLLRYRFRAVFGDIASTYMVFGMKEATKIAALSAVNVLPTSKRVPLREAAIGAFSKVGGMGETASKALIAAARTIDNGTQRARLLAPGTWSSLPRRTVAAILDGVATVPRALMGVAPRNVSVLLSGEATDVLEIGKQSRTVAQWWAEMRTEGILDNNVQINLRTALQRNTEMWAEITSRRYSWWEVRKALREARKNDPTITEDMIRQRLEAGEQARTISRTQRIKYALMRWQESLEKAEAEVHVTTRVALYTSLREQGLSAAEASAGVKAAVYDWNYGANKAALQMLAFVPFGRFHLLRRQQGIDLLNLQSDTSIWRQKAGPLATMRRAVLLEKYLSSINGEEPPTEAELDQYLSDARAFGTAMAEEWRMSAAEAALAAEQETLSFIISGMWARAHSPDYLENRDYYYQWIPTDQQETFKKQYGYKAGETVALTSALPPVNVIDAFDVLVTGATMAEIAVATMQGEDLVAQNAMQKLVRPYFDKLPDVAKAAVAVLAGKASLELDEDGLNTAYPNMLTTAKPAEAAVLNSLGYLAETMGADGLARDLLTTTRGDDNRPRVVGVGKSLLSLMRMDPVLTPLITKTLDASIYKNPQNGRDWDAIRAAYTFSNLVGITSFGITSPMREAEYDKRDIEKQLDKKKQTAAGRAAQGGNPNAPGTP